MPANAQLSPGYSGQSTAPIAGVPDDYWLLLREISYCVPAQKYEGSVAFLAEEPASAAETRAFKKLFGGQRNVCMRDFVGATFLRAHLRGAVAEGLYKKIYAARSAPIAPGQPLAAQPAIRSLHDFARCFVADHETMAHRLITETKLGSDDERASVRTMAANFGPCLPERVKAKINPTEVRMALAEALYRAAVGRPEEAAE
jgi:hypothetical protein